MFESFSDLLARWGVQELAVDLGINYQTAAAMKRRGSVAPRYWDRLIFAASVRGVTLDHRMLTDLHTKSRVASPTSPTEPERTGEAA